MPKSNGFCPRPSGQPPLRGEEWPSDMLGGAGAVTRMIQHLPDGVPRGKRGPIIHESTAASPRMVRARLQDQVAPTGVCYFAATRRCSFVERRAPRSDNDQLQDSWDPSCIEPGAFASVGSGTEGTASSVNAPCGDRRRQDLVMPVATPVRAMVSMGVQTNRQSILAHHRRNCGGGDATSSDSERDDVAEDAPREAAAGQHKQSAPHPATDEARSARSALTGKMSSLNTGRSVLRDLQFPKPSTYAASDATTQELRKAATKARASKLAGHAAIALTLSRAVLDTCADLDRSWGVGRPGGENRSERIDKLANILKKVAKKAEKTCVTKALLQSKVSKPATMTDEHTSAFLEEQCALLEAQIAASDQRAARLREALHGPDSAMTLGLPDPHKAVADLLTRLPRNIDSEEVPDAAQMPEIEGNVEDVMQGLGALIRAVDARGRTASEGMESRSRAICEQAAQAPSAEGGGLHALKAIK